jgi:hypothetical protein
MTKTAWISVGTLVMATMLKVIYTVLDSSGTVQTDTFVVLAVLVLLLPKENHDGD